MSNLAERVLESAYLTGSFKLRSGVTSSYYFDKYRFESDPRLLAEIARELLGRRRLLPRLRRQAARLAQLRLDRRLDLPRRRRRRLLLARRLRRLRRRRLHL